MHCPSVNHFPLRTEWIIDGQGCRRKPEGREHGMAEVWGANKKRATGGDLTRDLDDTKARHPD